MRFRVEKNDVLLIVDVQNDFCPNGTLPVPSGDKVIPILNEYIRKFKEAGTQIYATQDWHPLNHQSFKSNGGIWPPHCIKGTEGAEFCSGLNLPKEVKVIQKGTKAFIEGYSGFYETDLEGLLRKVKVKRVFVGGLATEYCVKSTVLDALRLGFETVLLLDAILGVNIQPNDSQRAIKEMVRNGTEKASIADLTERSGLVDLGNTLEDIQDNTLRQDASKKKGKMKTRGPYRKALIK